jgi:hypothetical protein
MHVPRFDLSFALPSSPLRSPRTPRPRSAALGPLNWLRGAAAAATAAAAVSPPAGQQTDAAHERTRREHARFPIHSVQVRSLQCCMWSVSFRLPSFPLPPCPPAVRRPSGCCSALLCAVPPSAAFSGEATARVHSSPSTASFRRPCTRSPLLSSPRLPPLSLSCPSLPFPSPVPQP